MTTPGTASGLAPGAASPVDQANRDIISDDLGSTLFVEASAGTGKTTSLVQRVTNLVSTGTTTLDRIAAITFTEAAAAELRDRVRAALDDAAADAARCETERKRCRQGIVDLDRSDISTLHSFAGALLRERPLEAGLPPSFETSDQIVAGIKFEEEWNAWLDRHLDGDTELGPHLALALTLGLTMSHMRNVARAFHQNYSDLEDVSFDQTGEPAPSAAQTILDAAGELERLCGYSKLGEGDQLYDHVQVKLGIIRRLAEAPNGSPAQYRLLRSCLPLRQNRGRQGDWNTDPDTGGNACAVLKDLLGTLHEDAVTEIERTRRVVLLPILEDLRRMVLDYAQKRRAEGRAEFQDLLVWARELLRDNLPVRDYFRGRYTHLLIDEAQDTDPIQAEIAMLLAEAVPAADDAGVRPTRWDQVSPEPGKLFVVGDPKQSIYRFRRADVEQMERLRSRMEQAGGETVKLVQNFRSQQPVVGWVNRLFEQWMSEDQDDASGAQAAYEAMAARPIREAGGNFAPRVWALGDEAVDAPVAEIRAQEALEIGTLLRQMIDEEWATLDREATESPDAAVYRPVRYSDVCILMPRRTGLAALERGLEEWNIPYRLESASLVFETQEIRDLLNCLKAIDDPSDQVATVAALRSPAFGCSDVDLLRYRDQGGSFDYLSAQGQAGGTDPALAALEVLRGFHRARLRESTGALIDRFIRDRGLLEAATGQVRMREQWRRYRFLVEQAALFSGAGGGTLRDFLGWVDDQINEGARVTEAPVPESDEEAVRVMTIHGSKGLEFPVVILTGLNSAPPRSGNQVIVDRAAGRVEVGVGPANQRFATPGFEELTEHDNRMTAAEHIRVMYVATTRARDHLVLSLRRPAKGAKTTAAVISEYMESDADLWHTVKLKGTFQPAVSQIDGEQDSPAAINEARHSTEALDAWSAARQQTIDDLSRPLFVSATGLSSVSDDDKQEPTSPEPWRRGRAGTSVGRAVHAVLQSIDLATGEGIEHRARAQAIAEGVPDREAEVVRLAGAAVNSDIVRRAVASKRIWREVPVAAPVGNGSLHGFIDLLFEEDNGLVVVDYKTDDVTDQQLPVVMERYRLQGGAYAHAIEQITGKPVKEVVFLFLQPKSEVALPNLAGAMADARNAAQTLLEAGAG